MIRLIIKELLRLKAELVMDNLGLCRFHRGWAEEMLPEIVQGIHGLKEAFLASIEVLASRLNSRNASVYWEAERNLDYVITFLRRLRDVRLQGRLRRLPRPCRLLPRRRHPRPRRLLRPWPTT